MKERAVIHVGGPKGAGKTAFVEAIVGAGSGGCSLQVQVCRDLEGVFRWTEELSGWEDGELILLAAVGEKAKAPALLVAEIAQPAQVRGCVAQTLLVLLARLRPMRRRPVCARLGGFRIRVDIAELSPKADFNPCVAAAEVLLAIPLQA